MDNTLRKAAEMALKVFESMNHEDAVFKGEFDSEVEALRQALAQRHECETCANKIKRLTEAGFLKSPLRRGV